MALSILDGNQTATTLSTVVTSGQHITAHTIVSLGTQAITEITGAVSGSVVTIPNLNVLARSVATDGVADATLNFVKIGGHQDGSNQTAHIVHVSSGGAMKVDASDSTVTFGTIRGTVTIGNSITIGSLPAISGTVTANLAGSFNGTIETVNDVSNVSHAVAVHIYDDNGSSIGVPNNPLPISGTVTIGSALPAGTNRIGVVTIGAGTVTIGAGTAQIGSVTASISGTVPISISSVTIGNSLTIGSLPAISGTVTANIGNAAIQVVNSIQDGDGTTFGVDRDFPVSGAVQIQAGSNQIGSVTANTFAVQGTAVTTSNFTSTTASTVLANFNATREVLTIFNEGAGNLHVAPGATCTTIAYQVRLSAGDYYEVPNHQTTITHSAVFATAGTARVTQVS